MARLRPAVATTIFAVLLGMIANLAWLTAQSTRGPWFSAGVTLQAYSVTMVAALIVAVGLAAVAASRAARLDDFLRAIDLRIAAARDAAGSYGASAPDQNGPGGIDREIDDFLVGITGPEPSVVLREDRPTRDSVVRVTEPTMTTSAPLRTEVLKEMLRQRLTLTRTRRLVWPVVAGPIVASIIFIAISGAMLPGSEGFAESSYQLNTTFILFLGYGWFALLGWAVTSLALLAGQASNGEP
jgi:hypothetical protein